MVLLTIQRIVKLLNQNVDPEPSITKVLQLLEDQVNIHKPCVLLPDETTRLFQIAYAAGVPAEEYQSIQAKINNHIYQDQLVRIQSIVAKHPAVKKTLNRYNIPLKHCVIAEDWVGIPIMHDNILGGMFAASALVEQEEPFNSIIDVLCISSTIINHLLQISALARDKGGHTADNNLRGAANEFADISSQHGIVGKSDALQNAVKSALRAASSQASVMLLGESGTGKEKFARMIHNESNRKNQPFIAINCAAIPENLLESELFGHEKGSFTGATNTRKGKFELASGGTLFLDEIGDMSLDLQSKLLRVLQENVLQRIGGTEDIPVNVRIITATHKNMQSAVNDKVFRLDLFYRLNVIRIKLPPLRERKGDISLLTRYFWIRQNEKLKTNITLTQEAIGKFERYCWPGNIRQLENVIERAAVIMSDGNIVTASDIEQIINEESKIDLESHSLSNDNKIKTEKVSYYTYLDTKDDLTIVRPYCRVTVDEKEQIVQALKYAKGNKTYAAKKLGLTPRQLHYRMEKLKIEY